MFRSPCLFQSLQLEEVTGLLQVTGPHLAHILVSAPRPPQVILTCVSLSVYFQLGPRETAPNRKIHLALGALSKRSVTKRGTLGPNPLRGCPWEQQGVNSGHLFASWTFSESLSESLSFPLCILGSKSPPLGHCGN